METLPIVGLINNIALLVALGVLYETISQNWRLDTLRVRALTGLVLGSIGVAVMMNPWRFSSGIIFDARSILLSVGGLFFGWLPAVIALIMTSAYRFIQGGTGAWTGVGVIVTSGVIGLVWGKLRHDSIEKITAKELLLLGIVVHAAMLLWMFTLPWPVSLEVLRKISLPVMLLYPVGTILWGKLLAGRLLRSKSEEEMEKSEQRLRTVLQSMPVMMDAFDETGAIIVWNRECEKVTGFSAEEIVANPEAMTLLYPDEVYRSEMIARWKERGNDYYDWEWEMSTKEGEVRAVAWSNISDRFPIPGFASWGIGADVTGRKRAEDDLRESQEKIRLITDSLPALISYIDSDQRYRFVNRTYELWHETPAENILGKDLKEVLGDSVHPEILPHVDAALSGQQTSFEIDTILGGGKQRNLNVVYTPHVDEDGVVKGFVLLAMDITERKKAEKALWRSEGILRDILDNAIIHIWAFDGEKYSYLNKAYYEFTGQDSSMPLTIERWTSVVHPDDLDRAGETWRNAWDCKSEHDNYFRLRGPGGRYRDFWCHAVPIFDEEDQFSHFQGFNVDITDRKRAEENLAMALQRLTAHMDNSPLAIVEFDGEFRVVRWSGEAEKVFGWTSEEILGKSIAEMQWVHDEDKDLVRQESAGLFSGESPRSLNVNRNYRKDGSVIHCEWYNSGIYDSQGKLVSVLSLVLDITDRTKAEQELLAQRDLFSTMFENAPYVSMLVNSDGRLENINRKGIDFVGRPRESLLGLLGGEVFRCLNSFDGEGCGRTANCSDCPVRTRVSRTFETGESLYEEEGRLTILGESSEEVVIHFLLSTARVMVKSSELVMVTLVDITDRKRAEEQIKASLAEKEVMLREIHHRVKNNLAVMSSLLILRSEYSTDKAPQELFRDMEARIRSMAVAHEILYESENLAHLSVSDYVGNLLDHIVFSHGSVGPYVALDKEIEEVSFGLDTAIPLGFILTELVSNCLKHAFPDGKEGRVGVSLRSVKEHEFELIVADNGCGIPESIDWKNPQSMGLELISTFVEQLHGLVEINRNEGTVVRIRFKEIGHKVER